MASYATIDNLKDYKEEKTLAQLYGSGGAINTTGIESIITDVSGYIDDYLAGVYAVPVTVPKIIKLITIFLTICKLYSRGEQIPDDLIAKGCEKAKEDLEKIRMGDIDPDEVGSTAEDDIVQSDIHDVSSFNQDTLKVSPGPADT